MEESQLEINGEKIETVQTLNILGIPVNNRLKLDTRSKEHSEKLGESIKRLHNYSRLGVINTAQERRTLTDSFINSRHIENNWPLIAIDGAAANWIDKKLMKSIKTIHDWPNNISNKLITLVTKNIDSLEKAKRRMAHRAAISEYRDTYEFLIKMSKTCKGRDLVLTRNHPSNDIHNLKQVSRQRRKHPNPTKPIRVTQTDQITDIMHQMGPMWAILERNKGSMMVEFYFDAIMQNRVGYHHSHRNSYFNSMALIIHTVKDTSILNRNILMSSSNSLLRALENPQNHDWRIIELRESLYDNGWRIYKVNESYSTMTHEHITEIYRKLSLKEKLNSDNFNSWLLLMQDIVGNGADETQTQNSILIQELKELYLEDYIQSHRLKWRHSMLDKTIYSNAHTGITRALCPDTHIWQDLTPNWLDGRKLLMLSGLTTNNERQLTKGNNVPNNTCEDCTNTPNPDPTTIREWHKMT